jgi:DNA end-binding protein Ku
MPARAIYGAGRIIWQGFGPDLETQEVDMAGRPFWSGQLKISLVSFGIELYPATKPHGGIAFHQIDRKTGQRVRHLNVINDEQPVDNSEIVKGYEYSKGEYIVVEPEEIARLRIETRKTVEVGQFVDVTELSPSLFENPYFVLPASKESTDAFAVLRRAMEQTGKAALGEIAFGGREHLIAITAPKDEGFRGMTAYTLRYGEELRNSDDFEIPSPRGNVDKKQFSMAVELIRAYSSPLKLDAFEDDYEAALRQLIEAKQKHLPLPLSEDAPRRTKVTNLMDALRRSVNQAKRAPARQKASATGSTKKGPVLVKGKPRRRKAA